jgi:hypothetical protein
VSIWSLDRYSPESRRDIGLDATAGLIALALLVLVAVDFSAPLRLVLALLFTFYVPGRAIVSNWPRMARWSGVGMSIVLSLGVLTLLATLSLWAGLWHPLGLYLVESLASLVAIALSLARQHQARSAGRAHLDPSDAYAGRPQADGRHGANGVRHPPWRAAEAARPQTASRPSAKARHTAVAPWRLAGDTQAETPPWPAGDDRSTEAFSWAPGEDTRAQVPIAPSFRPAAGRQADIPSFRPAEDKQAAGDAQGRATPEWPAEDGLPQIQAWRTTEDGPAES